MAYVQLSSLSAVSTQLTAGNAGRHLACALFGHDVNDLELSADATARRCACGVSYLAEDGALTRIRHTVSCFLRGHKYHRIAARDGHHEYLCGHCGHTLLFTADTDPFADRTRFVKKVRYQCNLLGHSVRTVAKRADQTEYACGCGHTFLKDYGGAQVIKHPPICTFAGHFVRFVCRRDGHAEYRCVNCGHPFCFPVHP